MASDIPFLEVFVFQPVLLPWDLLGFLSTEPDWLHEAGPSSFQSRIGKLQETKGGWPPQFPLFAKDTMTDLVQRDQAIKLLRNDYSALKKGVLTDSIRLDEDECDSLLLFNRHGTPQILFHLTFRERENMDGKALLEIFTKMSPAEFRKVLFEDFLHPLAQNRQWANTVREAAYKKFAGLQDQFKHEPGVSSELIEQAKCFPPYTDHIVVVARDVSLCWQAMHQFYESPSQIEKNPKLCERYPGSFMHFGWGCSTIAGIPAQEVLEGLQLLGFIQSSWYQFRYFRKCLLKRMEQFADPVQNFTLDAWSLKFDRLVIDYEKFFALHCDFRASQKPVLHDVFEMIEKAWHMNEDFQIFKQLFGSTREFIERRYRRSMEEHERRQQQFGKKQQVALNAIALIQILTLISIITDYINLNKETSWNQASAVWLPVFLLLVTVGLFGYLVYVARKN